MIVKAYQTAFHREGEVRIRPITIPDEELDGTDDQALDRAWYYGQNDFQPVPECYSTSVGDVLELPNGRRFRVLGAGFKELEAGEDPTALTGRAANKAGYGF